MSNSNPDKSIITPFFKGRVAVFATMHGKESVVRPIFERSLGISVVVPEGLNTDIFGTFSRDIERQGSPLETARTKILKALEITGETIGVASEGSFGPHPMIPFVPGDEELIVLLDTQNNIEVVGRAVSTKTNFASRVVETLDEALAFATKVGFPDHGLIMMTSDDVEVLSEQIVKGIVTQQQLEAAFEKVQAWAPDGKVRIETDMRAMYNPSRMQVIEQACLDLVKNLAHSCPNCQIPGMALETRVPGLLCSLCGLPTDHTLKHRFRCGHCDFVEEILYPEGQSECDPGFCKYCNP